MVSVRKLAGASTLAAGLLCASTLGAQQAPERPDGLSLRNFPTYWLQDRTKQDDFLPPESGFGPVTSELGHPYVPNGERKQQTSRIADLSNPILKPWVIEQMAKPNTDVRAGKIPFIARERCWPTGVPGFLVYAHAAGMYVVQTEKEILIVQELDQQTRHIYMNVPHSKNPKPSWYGESVGHFEGGELVVDTIGMNDKSFVDNYRTPHTDQIHVVERFKMVDGGKALQVTATVEDPGAFNMPWSAVQRWKRGPERQILEQVCAENSEGFYDYDVVPMPQAKKPDF
jgi:hypothetical protein